MYGQQFGCEIETVGLDPEGLLAVLGKGVGDYIVKEDGSLSDPGCEIACPIMTENDLPALREFVKTLVRVGCRTDHTCGLHVHVGVDTTTFNYDLLDANWNNIKKQVASSYRPREYRKRYCKFQNDDVKYSAIRKKTNYDTVEFRLFNGCLSFRYIVRAIRLSCGLVFLVKNGIVLQKNVSLSVEAALAQAVREVHPVGVG